MSQKPYKLGLYIFQRDWRLTDQLALSRALELCEQIHLIGILDLKRSKLPMSYESSHFHMRTKLSIMSEFQSDLETVLSESHQEPIKLMIGDSLELIQSMANQFDAIFMNVVMEPHFLKLYAKLQNTLNTPLHFYKDHEPLDEKALLTKNGGPYKVFTPFYKQWRQRLNPIYLAEAVIASSWPSQIVDWHQTAVVPSSAFSDAVIQFKIFEGQLSSSEILKMPLKPMAAISQWETFKSQLMATYDRDRDYPSLNGTSEMSLYINNGLISYRQLIREALADGAEPYLRQLAWRHFYMLILFHYPHVEKESFIKAFKDLKWSDSLEAFEAWKRGETGYSIVDAAMKALAQTGKMHNRLRMICASFLVKDLDINWQWGEAYFYEKLLDADLALNNGGWQWCASTGNDAQPYFRIFNPEKQADTYDSNGIFRAQWLDEAYYKNKCYIVNHSVASKYAQLKYKLAKEAERHHEEHDTEE